MKQLLGVAFIIFISNTVSSQDSVIRIKSAIRFPFSLTYRSLEETTNKAINGLIYIDSSYTDDDNDQFKCKVWKNGNISITPGNNHVLKIDVPLKVWAEKGIGTLGIYHYRSTQFQLTMSFQMVYNITPDWKLKTQTFKNGYTWSQKPSLNFGKIEIPITPIIEKILNKHQQEYAHTIDEQIEKNINVKGDIISMWNLLKKPQLISEEYKTWLTITPIGIEATPFIQDATAINSNFKLNIITETFLGNAPKPTPDVSIIPNLKFIRETPQDFELYTTVHIPYSEATDIAKKKFLDQTFEFQNGKKVTLKDIAFYSTQGQLMVEADLKGSFNGKVYIQGTPYYEDSSQIVKLKDVQFDLKTKNLFYKTANWLFNGIIEKKVQENFSIPTKESMELAKNSTQSALNQTKNGINYKGNIYTMIPKDIYILSQEMALIILLRGNMKVEM